MRRFVYVTMLVVAGSCARVMSPPGGPRDTESPRIVETDPAQNSFASRHAGTNRPVRIVFHETLSERGPREMALVSPETGEVEVERDGEELRITIEGGWQPGKVYRVTVLPGLVDRHSNARTTTYELLFSTGGTILDNALGGIATDRITGRPAANARVEAVARADSTVYTTVTDSGGFFALRALPVGAYYTRIYVDQNRNRTLDMSEARAATEVNVGLADTLAIQLSLLGTDTTAARLVRAEVRDSLQVSLTFDDYTEPSGVAPLRTTVWQLPDSTVLNGGTLLTEREFRARQPDSLRAPLPTPAAAAATPIDTTGALPINQLIWVPAAPLQPNVRYRFQVTGYVNLHGIPNGGGSVTATAPARVQRVPPAAPDTTRR